ncbi:hypothetical protein [Halorussus amylolyticus]|uniref:hypothetical protein n=1 Tax=Halorussus amylolyticus TaxID=1126242 RepID=UPI001053E5E1|nr:hypothetical protein [Halorussus amylolyticus]
MEINRKTVLALLAVLAVVGSGVAAAATYGMNPEAEQHPETKFVEDELTVESHDRSNMDWLEYEDDNGEITEVEGHVNGTDSGAEVAYRADRIDAEEFDQFPRTSGEENNSVTWLNAENWTTSGSAASVKEADGETGEGVQAVEIDTDGSLTAGDSEHVAYEEPSITSDAEKRYLQLVMNVDDLESGAELSVQVRDGDGDYVEAEVNSSRDATASDVIANETASGVVYQEQLGQLDVDGSGDGSLDAVEEVRVVTEDGDATATVIGLNVEKKSRWDLGEERVLDTSTDDGDDYTDETVYERPEGGEIEATDLSGMGEAFTDATVNKLRYLNIEYRMQDDPDAATIEFPETNNYPNYANLLDVSFRQTIPTAYDLTHGDIELKTEQPFLSERYTQIRYAEGVGDTDTEDISEDDWIDLSGELGDQNRTITADSTVQTDTTYVVEYEVKLLEDQYSALQPVQSGGGFWGSSGGGGGGPFASMYNWVAGGIAGLLTMVGLKSRGS